MHDATASSLPTVIVLASGRGERFRAAGGSGHKLEAPLGTGTVLGTTLAAVRASGLPWHLEDAGHPGMGDSIQAAKAGVLEVADVLVVNKADRPDTQPSLDLDDLIDIDF